MLGVTTDVIHQFIPLYGFIGPSLLLESIPEQPLRWNEGTPTSQDKDLSVRRVFKNEPHCLWRSMLTQNGTLNPLRKSTQRSISKSSTWRCSIWTIDNYKCDVHFVNGRYVKSLSD